MFSDVIEISNLYIKTNYFLQTTTMFEENEYITNLMEDPTVKHFDLFSSRLGHSKVIITYQKKGDKYYILQKCNDRLNLANFINIDKLESITENTFTFAFTKWDRQFQYRIEKHVDPDAFVFLQTLEQNGWKHPAIEYCRECQQTLLK